MKPQPKRYANLLTEIDRLRARRILEVGTYKGGHALQMIEAAATYHPVTEVEYFGFDLFAHPPEHEHTSRTVPPAMEEVEAKLCATGARIVLVKGDTRVTLPTMAPEIGIVDLVFLDGGHSDETVASDWQAVQSVIGPETVVILDDYWNYRDGGCNALVNALPREEWCVDLLEPIDEFQRPYGTLRTQFVRVKRRKAGTCLG